MTRTLTFASEGAALRGAFYPAAGAGKTPIIVMAHGFSAVAAQLEPQARAFAEAGLSAFVFDHAGFGLSDGYPRQEVDPVRQVRGYRDAVSFVRTLDGVDPDRIGIWGSSFSGGHVLQAGALDLRVKCVVSQAPFVSGLELFAHWEHGPALVEMCQIEREARGQGAQPTVMAVVAPGDEPCALPGADGFAYFTQAAAAPSWKNEITLSSLEMARAHEPGWWIDRIAPRALMMIVADDDVVTPTAHALAAFDRAGGPKKLVRVPGGHFDVYQGPGFDTAVGEAAAWFRIHLGC